MNDLVLSDGREPELYVNPQEITEEMEQIDRLLSSSLMMGNPSMLFGYVSSVGRLARVKGIGVARVLWETWSRWAEYQRLGIGDEWENVAPAECGLSLDQCRKYRDLYAVVYASSDVPQRVKDALIRKPIEGQLALRAAVRDGQVTDEDWEEIIDAVTPAEIKAVVRRIRGDQTSSGSRIVIVLDRQGILKAKRADSGKYVVVVALRNKREDLEGEGYEPTVRAIAIERILRSAGVVEP